MTTKLMYLNKLSMVVEKINFISQTITKLQETSSEKLFIKCVPSVAKDEEPNKVYFYNNKGILAKISTIDKYNGFIFDKQISVNLYDFYNIVNNCDDNFSMFLDEESNELVIGSYYNIALDYDEMEVRLPYVEEAFPEHTVSGKSYGELKLDAISTLSIIKELSVNGIIDGFYVIFEDNKLYFKSYIDGLVIKLQMKEFITQEKLTNNFVKYIDFSLFKLISGSGNYTGLTILINENGMVMNSKDYTFNIKCNDLQIQHTPEINYQYKDNLVIDTEIFFHNLRIINAINVARTNDDLQIEKLDEKTGDLILKNNNFTISNRVQAAMLDSTNLTISASLFQELFDRCGVDAISLKYYIDENNKLFIYNKLENYLIIKEIYYNHKEYKAIK